MYVYTHTHLKTFRLWEFLPFGWWKMFPTYIPVMCWGICFPEEEYVFQWRFPFFPLVLKPAVELLSNPDYINRMLLTQLEHREQMNEHHKRAYTYAPSYEEFIKLINSNSDVEFLKQLRYWAVNDSTTAKALMVILCLAKLCVCGRVVVCAGEREREWVCVCACSCAHFLFKEVEVKAVHTFSSLVTVAFVQPLFNRGIRVNFFLRIW